METISIAAIIILSCLALTMTDLAISGVIALLTQISFKKAFTWGLVSLAIPPLLAAYGVLIERNIYQIKKTEISFENLPEGFDGYRVVQISDIHARSFAKRGKSLQRAVRKINSLKPDLIVFTGDIVTMAAEELDSISDILNTLEAKDGVLSILGNHDYGIYGGGPDSPYPVRSSEESIDLLKEKQKRMGWDLLLDEHRFIRRGKDTIAVIGVENTSASSHFPSKGNLSKASEGTEEYFRILLSHDPTHWEMEVVGKDFPLMLSGHTHAMQFALFGWSPSRYIFKQNKGLYEKNGQYIYVNKGLGETIVPARVGTHPEITLHTLRIKP